MSALDPMSSHDRVVSVIEAILTRRATRAFTNRVVSQDCVETLISLASRAPSGSNIQPWKVYVCAGNTKESLSEAILAEHYAGSLSVTEQEEYQYYPERWRDPYQARRRKVGIDLYGVLGIAKGDTAAMSRQHARNYQFFGAPIGLFVTIPKDFPAGAFLDTGMFIQTLLLAARGFGLDTCPQQAFSKYHPIIRKHLGIPKDELVLCGIALGYADENAPENSIRTEREHLDAFVTWLGFDEKYERFN